MESTPRNYEVLVQETYEALLRPGDFAIDVGAHRGRHCIAMAARVVPTGQILAFEPLPMCRASLLQELTEFDAALAQVVRLYPYALSDFSGTTEFVVARDALAYSGLKERPYDWPTRLDRIPVQVKTLDEMCLSLPALRYVKVDAEGGEYHILKGAGRTLRKHRPVVVFEFGASSLERYATTPAAMADLWVELDYKVYDILGRMLTPEDFVASARTQAIWDYVAIPSEDHTAQRLLVDVLTQSPVWQRVNVHLDIADHNAPVGAAVPRLVGFCGWKQSLARLLVRAVIYATQVITRPQRACNQALLRSMRALLEILRRKEHEVNQQAVELLRLADSLASRDARLGELERKVEWLQSQAHQNPRAA
jgi:FkbM family methyltransferase